MSPEDTPLQGGALVHFGIGSGPAPRANTLVFHAASRRRSPSTAAAPDTDGCDSMSTAAATAPRPRANDCAKRRETPACSPAGQDRTRYQSALGHRPGVAYPQGT